MIAALIAVGMCYALWLHFLAVMAIQTARDRKTLTPWGLRFGYTVLIPGYLMDVLVQMTIATIAFVELPREPTVSSRIKRLVASDDNNWRKTVAMWLRNHMLSPFDPTGRHG